MATKKTFPSIAEIVTGMKQAGFATIPEMIKSMKEVGFATTKDLDQRFEQQRELIKEDTLETLANYHSGEVQPQLNELKVGQARVETKVSHLKDSVDSLKADFSTVSA